MAFASQIGLEGGKPRNEIVDFVYGAGARSQKMTGQIQVAPATAESSISIARALFREYAATPGVAECVKDFELEVESLPGRYVPPDGRLLLATRERASVPREIIGCVALRKFSEETCEMKRLYVRHEFRCGGAGRMLVEAVIAEARSIGYRKMLLDTLPTMQQAHKLYRILGFREIAAYQKNPVRRALFFELDLL
jgi:putative acetyltransferase